MMLKKSPYDLYFLSNLYDDDIIIRSVKEFNNFYPLDLLGSEIHQNNHIFEGDTNEFEINREINYKYNVNPDAYSLKLCIDTIPWYSEASFIKKYSYGEKLSSFDIMNDIEVFPKSLFLFIDEFLVYEITCVIEKSELVLFISHSNQLKKSTLDDIMKKDNSKWSLLMTTKASYFTAYAPRSVLIKNMKRIYISSLTVGKNCGTTNKNTWWTIYLSHSLESPNMMSGTYTKLKEDEYGKMYFELPEKYVEYMYTRVPTIKCLVVAEPNCTGTGIYIQKEMETPVFQIPYEKVPVPPRNLLVWKFDNDTCRKIRPLSPEVTSRYPDIYDFSQIKENCDLYIEWIEPKYLPRLIVPWYQDYINYAGNRFTEKLISGNVPSAIRDYEPATYLPVSEDMYPSSKFYGDYRAWKVFQLVYMMKDNPLRWRNFFLHMYYSIRKEISASYTYESHPHIYERSIMDNHEHCDNDAERTMQFTKPQAFIRLHNPSCRYRHCTLFIDGIRKACTYNMTYGSSMYVYFPAEWIKDHNLIQLDIGLINDIIKADDFEFRFNFENSEYRCRNVGFVRKHSLSDIMFYDHDTLTFIQDGFDTALSISIYDIDYKNRELTDHISFLDTDAELLVEGKDEDSSSDSLFYASDDFNFFIVKRKEIDHKITDDAMEYHKDFDLKNLVFSKPRKDILNKRIHCVTTDYYETFMWDMTSEGTGIGNVELWEKGVWNEDQQEYIPAPFFVANNTNPESFIVTGSKLSIMIYKGAHKKEHIRIFVDGLLQNPNLYDVKFPDIYGGPCIIETHGIAKGVTIVDYLPFEETIIYNGSISDLKKTGDSFLYLHDCLNGCPFDSSVHRVYINGRRVCESSIRIFGSGAAITIDYDKLDVDDTASIIIFQQAMDTSYSPYGYGLESEEYMYYNTTLIAGEKEYRDWLIDNK